MYSSKVHPTSGDLTATDAGVYTIGDKKVQADDVEIAQHKFLVGTSTGGGIAGTLAGDITATESSGTVTTAIGANKVLQTMVVNSAGVSGLFVAKYALALYDFATDGGGAPGAITLTSVCTIPDNAIVELVNYEVLNTCTSGGGDAGTIKVGLVTDGDLSTAIAISDASNPWDAGLHTAATVTPILVKTTAARAILVTSGVQALTAGKIVFCFRYWVSS